MIKTRLAINKIIDIALAEDGVRQDITTLLFIDRNQQSEAYIISRQDAVLCGCTLVKEIFKKIDSRLQCFAYHKDGETIQKNEPIIFLKGSTRSILSGERIALNFLARLSGIATLTKQFVNRANNKNVSILDTRKTTPGLRILERHAVICGEGQNHRRNLTDMVLIKDNHLAAVQNKKPLREIIHQIRQKTHKKVEIEIETLIQFKEALSAKPDIILLDNMTPAQIKEAVRLRQQAKSRVLLEASGGINLKNIHHYSQTGVDRISIGQLTHSAIAVDYSLEVVK